MTGVHYFQVKRSGFQVFTFHDVLVFICSAYVCMTTEKENMRCISQIHCDRFSNIIRGKRIDIYKHQTDTPKNTYIFPDC